MPCNNNNQAKFNFNCSYIVQDDHAASLFLSTIGKYTLTNEKTQEPTNESRSDEMLAYLTNAKSVLKSFALGSPCHSGNLTKLSSTLQKVMLFYLKVHYFRSTGLPGLQIFCRSQHSKD